MLGFTIISILITLFIWSNTVVYTYSCSYGEWNIDETSERKLPFNIQKIIGILLLLIPYVNIFLFLMYIVLYIRKMFPQGRYEKCTIYRIKLS